MYLIGIQVIFYMYSVDSLKEKRRIIRSIVDHVRSRYKISAAEVEYMDSLDYGSIGFAIVSNDKQQGEKVLQKVINYLDIQGEIEITTIEWVEA